MNKKIFLLILAVLLALISGIFLKQSGQKKKPINVVFLTIDALRPDHLHCYGYERKTSPNIDKVAKEGTIFTQTTCQMPWTTPSIASIMTSKYPQNHGVLRLFWTLNSSNLTLSEILKENGYRTCEIVNTRALTSDTQLNQGFDDYIEIIKTPRLEKETADECATRKVIEWIDKNHNKPFFLWVHWFLPHRPYQPPPPYNKLYDSEYSEQINGSVKQQAQIFLKKINLTKRDLYHMIALYDGGVNFADAQVGKVLDKLKQLGIEENTLIIISADHGECLYEHDYYFGHDKVLYESTVKIPLVIKYPRKIPKRKTIDALNESIDIMPTILDILGISLPKDIDGKSLLPLIAGKKEKIREEVFIATSGPLEKGKPKYAIRTKEWKFIFTPQENRKELYNLLNDPKEKINLAQIEKKQLKILEKKLNKWMRGFPEKFPEEKDNLAEDIKRNLRSLGYLQ